ncbi:hypothetical protein MLP_21230 [Microlunatus phosphovorus NM-1]|uniref:Uncharacterized protein n=1 Tax=Microlunatus phosphovorus (strain ATCC 700054 / DSM 10555 / JCM 9379 / NBRC 101784 / NCIMB 13414 / VKM Ac-1990 / NM-1) TaxID=1032480 RepID=F5XDW4_MICPN|nr:hypothetical protein MLP_21230 [Microlunatus phosphovorus NM-1]
MAGPTILFGAMTVLNCRPPRSAVMKLRESRSFVAIWNDEERVAPDRSCTPERLRT